MNNNSKLRWVNTELGFLMILALCALYFIVGGSNLNPMASVMPRWVAITMLIFIAVRLTSSIYRVYKPRKEEDSVPEEAEIPKECGPALKPGDEGVIELTAKPMNVGYTVLLMLTYFAAIEVLGFAVASIIYLAVGSYVMGYRKIRVIVLFSVLMTVSVVGTLSYFFQIPLPEDILIKLIRGY